MPREGTPDRATRRCGELIAQLRAARGWSRADLVDRLSRTLDPDDPCAAAVGEPWLARLETGRMVKLARRTLEALCRALGCTARERARLLLYADRNALADPARDPTEAEVQLHELLAELAASVPPDELRRALEAVLAQLGAAARQPNPKVVYWGRTCPEEQSHAPP